MIDSHFLSGVRLRECSYLESGNMVHLKEENTIIIPDDGAVYMILFMNGVDDDSIKNVCDWALNKVNRKIEANYEESKLVDNWNNFNGIIKFKWEK